MKVVFHCGAPFCLAHGGAQIQIEQTWHALVGRGVEVEPLRWWDASQAGEIIHNFGRMPIALVRLAQQKGIRVVMADLLTAQGSRSPGRLLAQKTANIIVRRLLPGIAGSLAWNAYRMVDACVALTGHEAHLMAYLFGAPPGRIHVVPNGVEKEFLGSQPATRGKWLICTATITERKRVLESAEAAVKAGTPLWIIGKPYAESDPYAQRFLQLARSYPDVVRFEGPVSDRAELAKIYRAARGFVLLSTMESLSLSALEAAACECPLLLSDLPWARTTFGNQASYCPIATADRTAESMRWFYDAAPSLPLPPKPLGWPEVADQLIVLYERLLSTSR
jgi:glycosyltransferase involved in cell wall biosynthesis